MNARDIARPELLLALQQGLPLVPRPFAVLGARVGLSERDVLACAVDLLVRGRARRLGGVFDARSLGYASTLCAVEVPARRLEAMAARLVPHPGVTHCYARDGRPNLWFTLTAPRARLDAARARVADQLKPFDVLDLPAQRTFKIEAVFDPRLVTGAAPRRAPRRRAGRVAVPRAFDARARAVVRRLQGSIPLVPEPFTALAAELGWPADRLRALLARWERAGVLRRIGLIVRHRQIGFAANGMCVWAADPAQTARAGRILAGFPEVTHCYARRPHARFPYNLFAMVHAGHRADVPRIRARLAAAAGLRGGRLLRSVHEFKKTSPRFFEEA